MSQSIWKWIVVKQWFSIPSIVYHLIIEALLRNSAKRNSKRIHKEMRKALSETLLQRNYGSLSADRQCKLNCS